MQQPQMVPVVLPSGSGTSSAGNGVDSHTAQMNQYRSYVAMLSDPNSKDVMKLKATQEISKNLDTILQSSLYPGFLDYAITNFLKILDEGEPHFIAEYNIQQVRKLILEMLYRLPADDLLGPHTRTILNTMQKLLATDNEENVLICLKIVIELNKQFKPQFNTDIQTFLQFVKNIYAELPKHMSRIFEQRAPIKVKDLSELNIEHLLRQTYTMTPIQTEKRNKDGTLISYYLIPRAVLSLKVLQELPIIVVLMYQLYKQNVHPEVASFVPLIVETITLQPTLEQREAPTFNREVFVDFIGAQIKTLSFLAYIIKIFQDVVQHHANAMVQGILGLLTLCPMEMAHLRRELLIAGRHILATDLRNKFAPYMEKLFDEDILLGRGWTTYESLRPLAYSTLADLVHHVRQQLSFVDLSRAVYLFSEIVHDDSLAITIQTMSCKLLLNLVDSIRSQSEAENNPEGRVLLMRMLEIFVLKFKTVTKNSLPILINKCKTQGAGLNAVTGTPSTDGGGTPIKTESSKLNWAEQLENALIQSGHATEKKEEKMKFGVMPPPTYNVVEYRSLVKTLVCGVKTITWGCASCKRYQPGPHGNLVPVLPLVRNNFEPHETVVFVRLVKWALKALDVYSLQVNATAPNVLAGGGVGVQRLTTQTLRSKEEKEVLEHFSGVFSMMNGQTFHEIFSTTIDYVVERVYRNAALQTVPNTLLANPNTSPIFATVLVEYLLERMEEMGSNMERSNLYLKLFKLVFGGVSLFPQENENMLRPHLHQIVNRSMELAMTAKEPYNYFLLLRALFRSIGGGSHDLLYQEFLPLLPNLLEGLNRLQSGFHKQHMKDLFVELCLTVPVRLSSLLPYLPMLMDPLVSALNGSHVLISQGLRTLELCVDNLQHDFLYEHIQPVRADLMQALWRTLRNNDPIAQVAFKVLGKFGGGNRKMITEPQKLDYALYDHAPSAVHVHFRDYKRPIELPVQKIIETAFNALRQSGTDSFYRQQAWEVLRCFLTASRSGADEESMLIKLFMRGSFNEPERISKVKGSQYKSIYQQVRETHQTALTGMFVAAAIRELQQPVVDQMISIVRHYTMVAVAQQAGIFAYVPKPNEQQTLDPLVLIDALAIIMGHEEKELCKPGKISLHLILDTASTLLGSKELACQLPLIEYLSERMVALCYERAWYAKLGGCIAINFLFERCAIKWVYNHVFTFLKALIFVMMDLSGEVSSGALDMAKTNLEKMLVVCVTPPPDGADDETRRLQQNALNSITHELVRLITSPHTLVREQVMLLLRLLADKQNKSVTSIMEPFKDVLADVIPPTKHLLKHQAAIAQLGIMDGNCFCASLSPRLFTIDMLIKEHSQFIADLLFLCNTDDQKLCTYSCYKSITNFVALRKSALRVLATCHYLETIRDDIFQVFYKALEKPNSELQQTAFECMKQFIDGYPIGKKLVHQTVKPLLMTLGDAKNLSLNGFKMLLYLTQLFPLVFGEKLCEQLLELLKQLLDNLAVANSQQQQQQKMNVLGASTSQSASSSSMGAGTTPSQLSNTSASGSGPLSLWSISRNSEEEQKIATIIGIFHQTPAATSKFIVPLTELILHTEQIMMIETSSPFRDILLKFLLRYPAESIAMFLSEHNLRHLQYTRYFEYILKHREMGAVFRQTLCTRLDMLTKLREMILSADYLGAQITGGSDVLSHYEVQYQSIRIISILIKMDNTWLSGSEPLPNETGQLVLALKQIWCNDNFQQRHKAFENLDYRHWNEPKLLVHILLHYFKSHTDDLDLLFQLLRCTCDRFIPEFQFLRDFLSQTVAHFDITWKRKAFFRFVELFPSPTLSPELKAKVIQLVLIPCFAASFEQMDGYALIGGPPASFQDSPDNIVSVFINTVIDPETTQPDCIRIALLQLACLLVEQASSHIHDHDTCTKAQGYKLRRLMTFAWPCLLGENCVDPTTRYHGHLLLSHIINKFAIHRRIVLQVFHSLLKAHAVEARNVVRQALEILTPAVPMRLDEGNTMLMHWTKKIIVDGGHSMQQLFHILQVVVKHYKLYYPVRHHLIRHMVNSMQRLGFSPTATLEHRKLAVELAEVLIKWEMLALPQESDSPKQPTIEELLDSKSITAHTLEEKKVNQPQSGPPPPYPHAVRLQQNSDRNQPVDTAINFLLRLACQVNDSPQHTAQSAAGGAAGGATAAAGGLAPGATAATPGEQLSRRCVVLLRTALKPELWPQKIDLKLGFIDKILGSVENTNCNISNICTALELLTFFLSVLDREQILAIFKMAQRGLGLCVLTTNAKVIKAMHQLLIKLMLLFPSDRPNTSMSCKYVELESLYSTISKFIFEGLNNYEKSNPAVPSSLFGTIMILKAACANNVSYIDLLIVPFMRVLQRLAKEHLQPSCADYAAMTSELLILGLDLVKSRVVVMGVEIRKTFIGDILVGLIEKSPDAKVMKSITKMLDEWMKCKQPVAVNQTPSIREKSILLVKMMQYVEKRFPDDHELNAQYLDLVNFVYTDSTLKVSELTAKLEQAFLAGLRCTQPHIRAKFFRVLDNSMVRHLNDRILYIVCAQNWDAINAHYWIKQCIELITATCTPNISLRMANETSVLPHISAVMGKADASVREQFLKDIADFDQMETSSSTGSGDDSFSATKVKDESDHGGSTSEMDIDVALSCKLTMEDKRPGRSTPPSIPTTPTSTSSPLNRPQMIRSMIREHFKCMETTKNVSTEQFILSAAQLCHMDTNLAEQVWLDLFPRVWDILEVTQRNVLVPGIRHFITSGSHIIQKDCHPSAINTYVEGMFRCKNPVILLQPDVMRYIGKNHNIWHRMTLNLETMAFDAKTSSNGGSTASTSNATEATAATAAPGPTAPAAAGWSCYELELKISKQDIFDNLAAMYSELCEQDLWSAVWHKHAYYKETINAVTYEQHGQFEQAQTAYMACMARQQLDHKAGFPLPMHAQREAIMWHRQWQRCAKELNQWSVLLNLGRNKQQYDPMLVTESSWRIPNWDLLRESLGNVEYNCAKEVLWKVTMYGGYLLICQPDENKPLKFFERYVESVSGQCLTEWRRLPHIVSHMHIPFLQAAQQIMELSEAYQIQKSLTSSNSLHDMKAIVKTWRNRLPVISDDLSHWNDILTWRQHHYQIIVNHYENIPNTSQTNIMSGVHASAQSIINYSKIARKQKLVNVCLDYLNRIYSIQKVPVLDCFQKIRQQVKCYLQLATNSNKNELNECLEVINSTNIKFFEKSMTAEILALKGMIYHLAGKLDDANKSFSAAVQMHDTSLKAWALYGDYLEQVFTRDYRQPIDLGVNAMVCFLHACRHQNESKARKHLAKVLWLLSYDDEKGALMDALDKYSIGVPPTLWLPWTPQLLNCLVQYEGHVIFNLLCQVGRLFPQAVYFPIRTLYLALRTAAARKTSAAVGVGTVPTSQQAQHMSSSSTKDPSVSQYTQGSTSDANTPQTTETSSIKATPAMIKCMKIMKFQTDMHPTVLSSLEGIAEQMEWFRENWYEEVLRQVNQALVKCYTIAFENRDKVNDAKVTPHILNFVNKLMSTFGIGVENISTMNITLNSAASESLAKRAEATYQDPAFKQMKEEFKRDFEIPPLSGSEHSPPMRLHTLIFKLKKWQKILDARSKMLLQSFLIEEKCQLLSNFTLKTAEVEIPGEFLLLKHNHYYVRILRFMPRVDVVQKHNATARRLYIRGHNGKIYPYLVINDSGLADARREERVLQLFRMMNHCLSRQKETSRRFLHYTVPRVVAVSQQIRLVEDNPASLSLLDIFKKSCSSTLSIDHDDPIQYYYERLASIQTRGLKANYQVYRDILKGVQAQMVPRTLLKQWAVKTFKSSTDYWHFRKMFTLQLSLNCFAEYVLHLTRLKPDMMYLHQDSGLMTISYFKFDVDDSTGELDTTRPVPFRLTPNLVEFIGPLGVIGPITASMIEVARCISYPNFKITTAILKTIMRDEMALSLMRKPPSLPKLVASSSGGGGLAASSVSSRASDLGQSSPSSSAATFGANTDPKLASSSGSQTTSQSAYLSCKNEQLINMVLKAVNTISNRLNQLAYLQEVPLTSSGTATTSTTSTTTNSSTDTATASTSSSAGSSSSSSISSGTSGVFQFGATSNDTNNTTQNFLVVGSKASTLVSAATSHDNLCLMDPAWHPWL